MMDGAVKRERFAKRCEPSQVTEYWLEITCIKPEGCLIDEAFSIAREVADPIAHVVYFESGWGKEYTPKSVTVTETLRIENRKGRSSADIHPQILVFGRNGTVYSYAVAWSGNWFLEIEPVDSGFFIRGGLSDWKFEKSLACGEVWATPKVIAAESQSGSLNDIGKQYHAWSEQWIPRNALSDLLPVEWNHWWAYEDKDINEETFLRNVDIAGDLGVEVCTLDAGWFGSDDECEHWFDVRGDWHKVNRKRFPQGIRYLSDYTHGKGMKFGLWCEIEGLGSKAELCRSHPQFVAKHEGQFLGYVCLASAEAQAWAYDTLAGMIEGYACDWIKLDFNLDPGYGCSCVDHGHGPHDGLYEHYRGLYRVLEKIRAAFPEVVLENCSSGGQRTDFGMMQHMHLNFLSDPDYSEHQLQTFWAATLSLPPQRCLHWVWSNTCGTEETRPFPSLDLGDTKLSDSQLTFHLRVAMLHAMGFSHRLTQYKEDTLTKLREHISFYKRYVRNELRDSNFYKLTPQAIRGGLGAGWNAFQYVRKDTGSVCLFVFRLEHGDETAHLRLEGLEQQRLYSLYNWDTAKSEVYSGAALMNDGIIFSGLGRTESYFISLQPEVG